MASRLSKGLAKDIKKVRETDLQVLKQRWWAK